jgi:hypothetical protein
MNGWSYTSIPDIPPQRAEELHLNYTHTTAYDFSSTLKKKAEGSSKKTKNCTNQNIQAYPKVMALS